jgi:predicted amidohydrolase
VLVIEPEWLAIVVFELSGLKIGVGTCWNIGYITGPKGLSAGVIPMLPYGFISARGVTDFWEASSKEGRMLSILGSIRCKAAGSTDSLRLELLPLEFVFCTR